MGREVRRVPPHWEHPRDDDGRFIPMLDETFEEAAQEWYANLVKWQAGKHKDQVSPYYESAVDHPWFWTWEEPPKPDYYRPAFTEEPTWFQAYQTVSEGTPVTPPFATRGELVDYLTAHGDYWDQKRGNGGWSRGVAEKFVESEYAPSLMVTKSDGVVDIRAPRDGMP